MNTIPTPKPELLELSRRLYLKIGEIRRRKERFEELDPRAAPAESMLEVVDEIVDNYPEFRVLRDTPQGHQLVVWAFMTQEGRAWMKETMELAHLAEDER